MNRLFSRKDASIIGRWWWTVDRWILITLFIIIAIGGILSFSASPAVAIRLNLDTFFFVKRHLFIVPFALLLMFMVSILSPLQIRRLSSLVYLIGIVFLILTLFYGLEIKGARRWMMFFGLSLQTSEIAKPTFAVLSAWMLSEKCKDPEFPGILLSFFLMFVLVILLLMQPDLGMTIVVVMTWVGQLFILGLPYLWMGLFFAGGVLGLIGTYIFFPHVTKRIDQFFDPSSLGDVKNELYQITQSLEAFMQGGLLGRGPGEGIIKKNVPDAHADFVFAVAGEEFGYFVCALIIVLFAFIVLRALIRAAQDGNFFVMLATTGLVLQFGMQAFVNMASTLHLIPTKGMTLPFLSYGGSSLMALALSMGMLLSLTRRRHGVTEIV